MRAERAGVTTKTHNGPTSPITTQLEMHPGSEDAAAEVQPVQQLLLDPTGAIVVTTLPVSLNPGPPPLCRAFSDRLDPVGRQVHGANPARQYPIGEATQCPLRPAFPVTAPATASQEQETAGTEEDPYGNHWDLRSGDGGPVPVTADYAFGRSEIAVPILPGLRRPASAAVFSNSAAAEDGRTTSRAARPASGRSTSRSGSLDRHMAHRIMRSVQQIVSGGAGGRDGAALGAEEQHVGVVITDGTSRPRICSGRVSSSSNSGIPVPSRPYSCDQAQVHPSSSTEGCTSGMLLVPPVIPGQQQVKFMRVSSLKYDDVLNLDLQQAHTSDPSNRGLRGGVLGQPSTTCHSPAAPLSRQLSGHTQDEYDRPGTPTSVDTASTAPSSSRDATQHPRPRAFGSRPASFGHTLEAALREANGLAASRNNSHKILFRQTCQTAHPTGEAEQAHTSQPAEEQDGVHGLEEDFSTEERPSVHRRQAFKASEESLAHKLLATSRANDAAAMASEIAKAAADAISGPSSSSSSSLGMAAHPVASAPAPGDAARAAEEGWVIRGGSNGWPGALFRALGGGLGLRDQQRGKGSAASISAPLPSTNGMRSGSGPLGPPSGASCGTPASASGGSQGGSMSQGRSGGRSQPLSGGVPGAAHTVAQGLHANAYAQVHSGSSTGSGGAHQHTPSRLSGPFSRSYSSECQAAAGMLAVAEEDDGVQVYSVPEHPTSPMTHSLSARRTTCSFESSPLHASTGASLCSTGPLSPPTLLQQATAGSLLGPHSPQQQQQPQQQSQSHHHQPRPPLVQDLLAQGPSSDFGGLGQGRLSRRGSRLGRPNSASGGQARGAPFSLGLSGLGGQLLATTPAETALLQPCYSPTLPVATAAAAGGGSLSWSPRSRGGSVTGGDLAACLHPSSSPAGSLHGSTSPLLAMQQQQAQLSGLTGDGAVPSPQQQQQQQLHHSQSQSQLRASHSQAAMIGGDLPGLVVPDSDDDEPPTAASTPLLSQAQGGLAARPELSPSHPRSPVPGTGAGAGAPVTGSSMGMPRGAGGVGARMGFSSGSWDRPPATAPTRAVGSSSGLSGRPQAWADGSL